MSPCEGIELEVLQRSKLKMYSKYLETVSRSDGIREINFRGKGSKKRKPQAILTVSEEVNEKEFCRLLWDQEYQEELRRKSEDYN